MNDGLKGDGNYRSGRYMGFYSNNVDATIDLQSEQEISEAFIDTYLVPGDYIFGLTGMEVYVSNDGKSFSKVASRQIPVLEKAARIMFPATTRLLSTRPKPATCASSANARLLFRHGIPEPAKRLSSL